MASTPSTVYVIMHRDRKDLAIAPVQISFTFKPKSKTFEKFILSKNTEEIPLNILDKVKFPAFKKEHWFRTDHARELWNLLIEDGYKQKEEPKYSALHEIDLNLSRDQEQKIIEHMAKQMKEEIDRQVLEELTEEKIDRYQFDTIFGSALDKYKLKIDTKDLFKI